MAVFTPAPITVDITGTTKFSDYRQKIQDSMTAFGTNINNELAQMFGTLSTETTYTQAEIDALLVANEDFAISQSTAVGRSAYPFSGHCSVTRKAENFVISAGVLASKNRFVQFGNVTVDTQPKEFETYDLTKWDSDAVINGDIIEVGGLGIPDVDSFYTLNTAFEIGKTYLVEFEYGIDVFFDYNRFYIAGNTFSTHTGEGIQITSGYNYRVITASTADNFIKIISGFTNQVAKFRNIKIIEVSSTTVPVPSTRVETGTTTTSDITIGDYVILDRPNRNVNAWTGADSIQNGGFSFTSTGIGSAVSQNLGDTYAGYIWKLKFNITAISGSFRFDMEYDRSINNDRQGNVGTFSTTGVREFIFTTTLTVVADLVLEILSLGVAGDTITVADIVLEQVNDIYRAKQFTPIGTELTNTAYFDVRPAVTNQYLILETRNPTTKAYEGLTTHLILSDAYAVETHRAVMLKNGFVEVESGLYSNGDGKLYTILGRYQSLNKQPYHPIFNNYGTALIEDTAGNGKQWFESTVPSITSIAELFNNISNTAGTHDTGFASSTFSGRLDGKFYDVVYDDQLIDMREFAKELTDAERQWLLEDTSVGIEDTVFTEEVLQVTIGTVATLEVSNGNYYKVGYVLQIWDGTNAYRRVVESVSGNTVTMDATIVKTAVKYIISGGKIPAKDFLMTDIISSPTYLPQIAKDILHEGKYLIGINLLMIDENGNSLIPDGAIDIFKLSRKYTTMYNSIRTTDMGTTWISFIPTSDAILNSNTYTNEPAVNCIFVQYIAKALPAQAQDIISVKEVFKEVVVSNHYDDTTTLLTGKIPTGNSTNSLETHYLKDALVDDAGAFRDVASHDTIVLDSADSTASKAFRVIAVNEFGEEFVGYFVEEGNPDTSTTNQDGTPTNTLGFGTTFLQLTNVVRTDVNNNSVRTVVAFRQLGSKRRV